MPDDEIHTPVLNLQTTQTKRAKVMAMILAGGVGSRLYPLTVIRSKPAVRFGGKYRIIDFAVNNMINSDISCIYVLTQYRSHSLIRHLNMTWSFLPRYLGKYLDCVPANLGKDQSWYLGTADAIYQNQDVIMEENPDYVAVFSGDHIYKMDVSQMLEHHYKLNADLTIAALPVPIEEAANRFGVIVVDEENRVIGFQEKPDKPTPIPGQKKSCLVSMGNYIFNADVLVEEVVKDAHDKNSDHDFGKNVIPAMLKKRNVFIYDFMENEIEGTRDRARGYWKDVGTVDSYWSTNFDLVQVDPIFNLYNKNWPIRTERKVLPPAKFVFSGPERAGVAMDSIVCDGTIISGARITQSILSYNIFVHSYANVHQSILFDNVEIGRHVVLNKVIVEEGIKIPDGEKIGVDKEADKKRFFISDDGVTVVFSQKCFI